MVGQSPWKRSRGTINIPLAVRVSKVCMNTDEAVRRITEALPRKHPALATERTYCAWLRRYCDCFKGLPSHLPGRVSPPPRKVKNPLSRQAPSGMKTTAPVFMPCPAHGFFQSRQASKIPLVFPMRRSSRRSRHFQVGEFVRQHCNSAARLRVWQRLFGRTSGGCPWFASQLVIEQPASAERAVSSPARGGVNVIGSKCPY
jgi:hypothetical protein